MQTCTIRRNGCCGGRMSNWRTNPLTYVAVGAIGTGAVSHTPGIGLFGALLLASVVRLPTGPHDDGVLLAGVALFTLLSVDDAPFLIFEAIAATAAFLVAANSISAKRLLAGTAVWLGVGSPLLLAVVWIGTNAVSPAHPISTHPMLGYGDTFSIAAVLVVWLLADTALRLVILSERGVSARHRLRSRLRGTPTAIAVVSASASLAVMWTRSPIWAIVISVGPFAVTQSLLSSLANSERVEDLTIRALGRLPEAAGLSSNGHSDDVSAIATAAGKLKGLRGRDLVQLQRAALLHDVGLLCAPDPRTGDGFSLADKGRWGAEIIGSSPGLFVEGGLVKQSCEIHRVPGSDPETGSDARGQIIQVSCAFSELRASGLSRDEAVEVLYSQSAFLHAPWAVSLVRPAVELVQATDASKLL